MGAPLSHFAINADDVEGARRFYEAVLGWTFQPWGPPEFYRVSTGDGGTGGALQRRRELLPGQPIIGLECTFAVDDVDAVARDVIANGGRVLMEKTTIETVGDLIWFQDPAGNVLGAMRYDEDADQ